MHHVAAVKHPPSQMILVPCCVMVLHISILFHLHHYEWTQVHGTAQREAEAAHACSQLHNLHGRWRSVSPIKGSHQVPEVTLLSILFLKLCLVLNICK